jgi:hypothetical protein
MPRAVTASTYPSAEILTTPQVAGNGLLAATVALASRAVDGTLEALTRRLVLSGRVAASLAPLSVSSRLGQSQGGGRNEHRRGRCHSRDRGRPRGSARSRFDAWTPEAWSAAAARRSARPRRGGAASRSCRARRRYRPGGSRQKGGPRPVVRNGRTGNSFAPASSSSGPAGSERAGLGDGLRAGSARPGPPQSLNRVTTRCPGRRWPRLRPTRRSDLLPTAPARRIHSSSTRSGHPVTRRCGAPRRRRRSAASRAPRGASTSRRALPRRGGPRPQQHGYGGRRLRCVERDPELHRRPVQRLAQERGRPGTAPRAAPAARSRHDAHGGAVVDAGVDHADGFRERRRRRAGSDNGHDHEPGLHGQRAD